MWFCCFAAAVSELAEQWASPEASSVLEWNLTGVQPGSPVGPVPDQICQFQTVALHCCKHRRWPDRLTVTCDLLPGERPKLVGELQVGLDH